MNLTVYDCNSRLNEKSAFELRECFDYIHPSLRHKDFPVTLPEFPEFYETIEKFRQECNPLVRKLLVILGLALKLEDPEFFLKCSTHLDNPEVPNESDFRAVYYPVISKDVIDTEERVFRCAEHTDYKTITLLLQDDAGGLEVLLCLSHFTQEKYCTFLRRVLKMSCDF